MANRTVKDAHSIHGTNPQYLVEKIIRTRIYESKYWKEECFGLTGEQERAEHPPSLPQPPSSHGPVFRRSTIGRAHWGWDLGRIFQSFRRIWAPILCLVLCWALGTQIDLIGVYSEGCHRSFLRGIPYLMRTYWVPVLTLKVLKERQYSRNQIYNLITPKSGSFEIFSRPSPNINICF